MENGNVSVVIDGVEYVKADKVVNFTGKESVASRMIGKAVIVRSRNEGINVGIVVVADDTGVEIRGTRRIYYHKPKDIKLSWYEGVAMSGLSNDSKVSGTVISKVIIEDYSMTLLNDGVYASIMEVEPNAQR